jgi:hypothetical protein
MTRTYTKPVDPARLAARGKSAATIIRLMMACNDMTLADEALAGWSGEQPQDRKDRQNGARMYFMRMQISHLSEGLKNIDEIRKDAGLYALVHQCDARTQGAFRQLEEYLPDGAKHHEPHQLAKLIRNKLAFHYDNKMINKALVDRAERPGARSSSITRASTAHRWRFELADEIVDSIVVRQIFGIPEIADLRVEVDRIVGQLHEVKLHFVDFAGEFIWSYCGK